MTQRQPNRDPYNEESLLTSTEVGDLLQVNGSSVNKWVEEGRLRAYRTPGGHRRIRIADLVGFLKSSQMPIPLALRSVGRRRLLVVDDEPRQLEAIRRLFKPHRKRVDVALASNGIDALVLVGSFKPDVVVLDIYMPQVDGLEVLRRLKANDETKHIDVIIASGRLTPELEAQALTAGARLCMHKPVDVKVLLEVAEGEGLLSAS